MRVHDPLYWEANQRLKNRSDQVRLKVAPSTFTPPLLEMRTECTDDDK